jgi:hypothetical protein
MPNGSITLRPGVNTQATPSVNEAGVSVSQLIRYKDGMIQAYGGWNQLGVTSPSTVRCLHAWQDLSDNKYLGIGATANLLVYYSTENTTVDITPQTLISNLTPNFSTTAGSATVTINDPNSGASIYNTVYFNTPIAVGGLFLAGAYPVQSVLSTGSYTITASGTSTSNVISSGVLPIFSLTNNSAIVSVLSPYSYYIAQTGLFYPFDAITTIPSTRAVSPTIGGQYQISTVTSTAGSSYTYTIGITQNASATTSVTMNASLAQLVYYVTGGPQIPGSGFGAGGFGLGGFGTGTTFAGIVGTPITTTDWSLDNWGDILIGCPKDGPVYIWARYFGYTTAQVVATAPFKNGGLFVSKPQQILVLWRSVQSTGAQDNLVVRWSDALDYTEYEVSNQTTAGSFRISTGSLVVGGIQGPSYALISTDISVWIMQYVGGDVIFQFTEVGTGCGWLGPHAAGVLSNNIYWMGLNNFFMINQSGVVPMPCSVWDIVFQNINTAYQDKTVCAVNSSFNELMFQYPSAASTGENDSYAKALIGSGNIEWDYGTISRTAWIDVSVLGQPIGVDTTGSFWQHETGVIHAGASAPSFTTGWWAISEGNDFSFVDFVIPDFVWGLRSGAQDAQMSITFFAVDYPGDTPRSYGPYTVTQATQYINTRIRGRLMSAQITSINNEFWRLGKIRFRFATSGRR